MIRALLISLLLIGCTSVGSTDCRIHAEQVYQLDRNGSLMATVTIVDDAKLTAAHAAEDFSDSWRWKIYPDHDLALRGDLSMACTADIEPFQQVNWYGFPAGSRSLTACHGTTLVRRSDGTWVVAIPSDCLPVVQGMSGGPVVDIKGKLVGIISSNNYPTDLDGDGEPEESFNFAPVRGVLDN